MIRFEKIILVIAFALVASCAREKAAPAPFVSEIKQQPNMLDFLPAKTAAVVTEITLRKSSILGRSFLYGSNLQFSSIVEEGADQPSTYMAIALGQIPADFQLIDNKLRLVSDARLDFESDVNAPSRLILEFPILRQDAETVTIRAEKASPILDTFLFGKNNKTATRASWIRSMEFAEADDLMLMESSVELMDGSLAEVMETITPRDRVVPEGIEPVYADPELNPLAARYRFLDSGDVYVNHPDSGRVKTKVATRFVRKNGEPIRWYVTPNVPDQYINDVKNGVEAWNRYSRASGMPDLVRFEGRLPEGIKVGDPRYNLIVWDNIQDAGSAYESQGADPFTGVQSHSMIYLPLAWINIGKEYWKRALESQKAAEARQEKISSFRASRRFAGRKLPLQCLDSAHLHISPVSLDDPETFGRELLKSVVFHEVGHGLGLNHNFKGSLAFDGASEKPHFSHSVMDYNQYNEELAAFSSLDGSDGPLLEYDRQIISVLYNEGKDVRESDPELPACNDTEADSTDGGVDPLCVRYDIGADPTVQAMRALDLLRNPDLVSGRMLSLPKALERLPRRLPDAASVGSVEDALKAVNALYQQVVGVTNIYVAGSANSLAYQGSQALRSLQVIKEGSLPEGYSEQEMRERSLSMMEQVFGLSAMPEATNQSFATLRSALADWLRQTPAMQGLPEKERATRLQTIDQGLAANFAATTGALLSSLRARFAGSLRYNGEAPLSFHPREGGAVDLEAMVIGHFEALASAQVGGAKRPLAERTAAVAALASYAGVPLARQAQARIVAAVNEEIASSTDSRQREELRKLLGALRW